MTTVSVPLNKDQESKLDALVRDGVAENRAALMRKALDKLAKDEAVERVLRARREPSLSGNLRKLVDELDA